MEENVKNSAMLARIREFFLVVDLLGDRVGVVCSGAFHVVSWGDSWNGA
jgi:hypothetical protein